jgi:hypothetical protein
MKRYKTSLAVQKINVRYRTGIKCVRQMKYTCLQEFLKRDSTRVFNYLMLTIQLALNISNTSNNGENCSLFID